VFDSERTWTEINLDALASNIRNIKNLLKPETKLLGVVKADAYGHGVSTVCRTMIENGVDRFAVSFINEAIELRKYGFDNTIQLLGYSPFGTIPLLVKYDIIPAVFDYENALAISAEAVKQGKTVKIHFKVDTGMGRIGFRYIDDLSEKEESVSEMIKISALPNIEVEGIFTHFATSDEADRSFTDLQYKRFCECIDALKNRGLKIPVCHCCNSAGIINYPEYQMDMVRPGIIQYGLYPAEDIDREKLCLTPVMDFKTRISHIKIIEKGDTVSYGKTFVATEKMKLATIPVGYADGFSRHLSGKGEVLVRGSLAKIVGRICMDQCMIDVTHVNNISVGDEVTVFGKNLPIEKIADMSGTINYEVTCLIGKRVPRIYLSDGIIVGTKDLITD